jgi:CDGSH-type Zn-finger protein
MKYDATESRTVFFCGCKHTKGQPFCDGSHKAL